MLLNSLKSIYRKPIFLTWISISTAFGAISIFTPMLVNIGFEFSLILSLIGSLGAGHIAAVYPSLIRNKLAPFPGAQKPITTLFVQNCFIGLMLLLPPLAILLVNSLWIPPCNLAKGLSFFLLLPVFSVAAASAAGLFIGLSTPNKAIATAGWFIAFAALVIYAFYCFHSTPAVFIFGPFFGYFPGVLYDRLIEIKPSLLTYRGVTLIQMAAILSVCARFLKLEHIKLSIRAGSFRSKNNLICILLVAAAVGCHFSGVYLGHRSSREHLEQHLSQKITTDALELYFPTDTDQKTVAALAQDAAFSLAQVENYFESVGREPISIFFFKNKKQKGKLMGASDTNVAKPWRNEIYVILDNMPHPVVRHEIAHAVAARFSRGPFAIAGSLWGILPNPGLIEGLAVAAQGPRGALTIHQWSAAMKQLKLLPKLSKLFGLSFLDTNAASAYTAAGSFCDWIHQNHTTDALRQLYSGASFKTVTGKTLETLEKQWLAFLETVPLKKQDLLAAQTRFDRPSIIRTKCVHEVAKLTQESQKRRSAGNFEAAHRFLCQAHARSGNSTATQLQLFFLKTQFKPQAEVATEAEQLLNNDAISQANKLVIEELIADQKAATTPPRFSRKTYLELANRVSNPGDLRRLHAKAHLLNLPPSIHSPLLKILHVKQGPSAPSNTLALLYISKAAYQNSDDPILAYLLARQFLIHNDPQNTLVELDRAYKAGLQNHAESIVTEAKFMQARATFDLELFDKAKQYYKKLAQNKNITLGAKETAKDWITRCDFAKKQTKRTNPK